MGAAFIHKILFGVAALWSLITFAVAAGLVSKANRRIRTYNSVWDNGTNGIPAAGAALAFGVLCFLYFTAALVLIFIGSALPVIADIVVISCLFVFGLGSVGALSTWAPFFSHNWGGYGAGLGSIGQATIALGWLLVVFILAILIYEVVVVVRNHGFNGSSLRSSFYTLEGEGGGKRSRNAMSNPVTRA